MHAEIELATLNSLARNSLPQDGIAAFRLDVGGMDGVRKAPGADTDCPAKKPTFRSVRPIPYNLY